MSYCFFNGLDGFVLMELYVFFRFFLWFVLGIGGIEVGGISGGCGIKVLVV